VTISQQLVTEPAVLVLDEPTSGLDSYTALHLMRTLKQVASSGGRIVLLSFHQPSPAMFSLLDRAYLMAQAGVRPAGWQGSSVQPGARRVERQVVQGSSDGAKLAGK
jgi:ABC-type multidrug transport system ATPase subunit